MVITGKGFGQTNLIAIDGTGSLIEEEQIQVLPAKTVLVLQSEALGSHTPAIQLACRQFNSVTTTTCSTSRVHKLRCATGSLRGASRQVCRAAGNKRLTNNGPAAGAGVVLSKAEVLLAAFERSADHPSALA